MAATLSQPERGLVARKIRQLVPPLSVRSTFIRTTGHVISKRPLYLIALHSRGPACREMIAERAELLLDCNEALDEKYPSNR